ncbi:MAG: hypothetical protein ACLTZT_01105 [Butyricimonas faecalis]
MAVAFELVNTFIEGLPDKAELDYYKQHKGFLRKHRIFETQARIDRVRKMSVRELLRKEKQLRDNWRIKSRLPREISRIACGTGKTVGRSEQS